MSLLFSLCNYTSVSNETLSHNNWNKFCLFLSFFVRNAICNITHSAKMIFYNWYRSQIYVWRINEDNSWEIELTHSLCPSISGPILVYIWRPYKRKTDLHKINLNFIDLYIHLEYNVNIIDLLLILIIYWLISISLFAY